MQDIGAMIRCRVSNTQLIGYTIRKDHDHLTAVANTIYMMILNLYDKDFWRTSWMKVSKNRIIDEVGLENLPYINDSLNLLIELGYIECRIVERDGQRMRFCKITRLDAKGNFIRS